jgi:hypothetical protein
MPTRLEKSRTALRVSGQATWDISDGALVLIKGRVPRRNRRGFPASFGVDRTAVKYNTQA